MRLQMILSCSSIQQGAVQDRMTRYATSTLHKRGEAPIETGFAKGDEKNKQMFASKTLPVTLKR